MRLRASHLQHVHVFLRLLEGEQRSSLLLQSTTQLPGLESGLLQISVETAPLIQGLLKSWFQSLHLHRTTEEQGFEYRLFISREIKHLLFRY